VQLIKYPIAKIHVWGGFGSQLYGVYTFLLLRKQNPKRKSQLVFHSSGVTARSPEVHLLNRNLPIIYVDDFSISSTSQELNATNPLTMKLSKRIKKLLSMLGVIDSLESAQGHAITKFRTIHFRGHYTYFSLDGALLEELISLPDESGFPLFALGDPIVESQLGIHFRLGDLLDLKSKTYLNPERISKLMQGHFSNSICDVVVYTDSLDDFWARIRDELKVKNVSASSKDPITTIQELVRSNIFIGTTSKISIWICIFRCLAAMGRISYMPLEMKRTLDIQLRFLNSSGVRYYS
jgi:hypothetical protein